MTLIPQEKTEHEQEESVPLARGGGGLSWGDTDLLKGFDTQEDSQPLARTGGGPSFGDAELLKGYDTQEDSQPSRDVGHPERTDMIQGQP